MARLIDGDTLIAWIKGSQQMTSKMKSIICYIKTMPTVEARPKGEWKHLEGDEWLCTECGHVIWTEGSWEHPLERGIDYCEHCGARMKGADDE